MSVGALCLFTRILYFRSLILAYGYTGRQCQFKPGFVGNIYRNFKQKKFFLQTYISEIKCK